MNTSRLKIFYKSNAKKTALLGICFHKARRMLVNSLLREYFKNKDGIVLCGLCGELISEDDSLHIDHITPWMIALDPCHAFFDLKNIQPAHGSCNCRAGRKLNIPRPREDYSSNHRKHDSKTGRFKKG